MNRNTADYHCSVAPGTINHPAYVAGNLQPGHPPAPNFMPFSSDYNTDDIGFHSSLLVDINPMDGAGNIRPNDPKTFQRQCDILFPRSNRPLGNAQDGADTIRLNDSNTSLRQWDTIFPRADQLISPSATGTEYNHGGMKIPLCQ
jgi:hypothetical protein